MTTIARVGPSTRVVHQFPVGPHPQALANTITPPASVAPTEAGEAQH